MIEPTLANLKGSFGVLLSYPHLPNCRIWIYIAHAVYFCVLMMLFDQTNPYYIRRSGCFASLACFYSVLFDLRCCFILMFSVNIPFSSFKLLDNLYPLPDVLMRFKMRACFVFSLSVSVLLSCFSHSSLQQKLFYYMFLVVC